MHKRPKRAAGALLKIAGTAFLIIGGVGIVLPLLPTTPFLMPRLSHKSQDITKFAPRIMTRLVKTLSKILRNIPKTPPPTLFP